MGTAYNANIVTDGLVLCLDAANPRSYPGSGTSWYDLSASKKNCSLVNGAAFVSDVRGGINLDGTNDYVNFNTTLYLNLNTTFIFWLKFNGSNTDTYHLLNTNINTYRDRASILYNRMSFHHNEGSTELAFDFSEDIRGKYKQIGITINDSHAYLIEDGTISQETSIAFVDGSREYKTIGRQSAGSGWLYFNGLIYNFLFYNKYLSANEVKQNFNATRGRYGI